MLEKHWYEIRPTKDELREEVIKRGYIISDGTCCISDDMIKGATDPAKLIKKVKKK